MTKIFMMKPKKIIFITFLIVLSAGFLFFLYQKDFSKTSPVFGVTFSKFEAEQLVSDWRTAYLAILDELGVKNLRLIAYWNDIERKQGEFTYFDLDWQIEKAATRNVKITLVIGQRVPRWPECYFPEWLKEKNPNSTQRQKALFSYLETLIRHYQKNSNIVAWQLENEPLLTLFGECPKVSLNFLKKEIQFIKSLDSRPIIITDSGELSLWWRTSQVADILGTTMYRTVWNKYFGYLYHPWPAGMYYYKAKFVKWFFGVKDVIISELQAEPWGGPVGLNKISFSEQFKSFDLKKFQKNLNYAKKSGISEIYLWGSEWWYYAKENGQPEFWQLAKGIWQ